MKLRVTGDDVRTISSQNHSSSNWGEGGALSPGTIIIITELSEEEAAPLDVIRRIHSLS